MGKSFFTGKDSELYISSNVFATQIAATPTLFGLTSSQASAYGTLNTSWRTKYEIANTPETRTKGAIAAKDAAREQLRIMASNLAKIIEGTPTVTDQQKIDLGISVRALPTPMPPPGQPNTLKVGLSAIGSLALAWKCENPSGSTGTIYQLWRQIAPPDGALEYIGGSGTREFTDSTLPEGSSNVMYQIQAVRSTAVGEFATFNVKFGTSSAGPTIDSVEEAPLKKAA